MTKIDIFSGFLGAGKTTLIKKLIAEAFQGEKLVLIENEFGEIAIDGGFLQDSGIEITEMSQGCICCSLVGDFGDALKKVLAQFHPDRILIEPSGVGKLSDVIRAVQNLGIEGVELNSFTTVADAKKCKMYAKNFGEFYNDQIEHAGTIILSRTDLCDEKKVEEAVALLRQYNRDATIVTTPISELSGRMILESMEGGSDLQAELLQQILLAEDDDDDDEHEHHHHHHDDDDEDEHEHHHDHDEHVEAIVDEAGNRVYRAHHHHHHHHHHGHDADEIFESWGMETPGRYTKEEIESILAALDDEETYGMVLRAKGMVPAPDGTWIHYDYVPGEKQVRTGSADVTGKICVIGSGLREDAIEKLFKRV